VFISGRVIRFAISCARPRGVRVAKGAARAEDRPVTSQPKLLGPEIPFRLRIGVTGHRTTHRRLTAALASATVTSRHCLGHRRRHTV
jgi:hypothetical protein